MLHRNLLSINTALTMLEIFSAFHWFCHWFEIQWCCKRPNLYCRTWLCVLQGKSLVQCHQAFFKFISSCLLGSIISASQIFFFFYQVLPHVILLSSVLIQSWVLGRRSLMIWRLLVSTGMVNFSCGLHCLTGLCSDPAWLFPSCFVIPGSVCL